MDRVIKFNAWIPNLGIMLEGVDVYANGMIGIIYDKFRDIIYEKENLMIDDDAVYLDDGEDNVKLLNLLNGDDYFWIEEDDHIKLQFTNVTDQKKNQIFEGDIVRDRYRTISSVEYYVPFGGFIAKRTVKLPFNPDYESKTLHIQLDQARNKFVKIGNIYQNPELLK